MAPLLKKTLSPRALTVIATMTLLVSVVMGRENPDPAAPRTPDHPRTAAADPAADLKLQVLGRSVNGDAIPDLFAPRNPPPVSIDDVANAALEPAVDAPPAAPSAPPLPFSYLGRYIDGEKTEIFIARGEEHYSVRKGETLDGQYKVEAISPAAVTFIYLPLGTRQKLALPVLN